MSGADLVRFGPFSFDLRGRILFKGGRDIGLPPKAADTLRLLLENAGDVVPKATLLDTVWAGVVVGEGSLTRTISILRKALGGNADSDAHIATVSKRGYRFVAVLERIAARRVDAADARVMLAVLPFEDLSPGRPAAYFSDGLTEEMIAQLSRLNPECLGVIARTSSMMFRNTRMRVSAIGAELGVHYALEGSVRRHRGRMRIAAELVRVADETQVWAEHFERPIGDVLRLQSEVAAAIAREIEIKLAPRVSRRLGAAPGVPAAAYESLLKGRHFLNLRTERGLRESIRHFDAALRHHPSFAQAHAGIADANVMLACRGMVPARETFAKARAAALRALELDAELGDAHGSLAHVRLHDWDWDRLGDAFRQAIELNPSLAIVYYWYAEFLMSQGRPEEAIAMTGTALWMDPLSPVIKSSRGMILYLARRFDEAAELLTRACEAHPDHFLPQMRLGLVRIQQRRHDEAICAIRKAYDLAERSTETLAALAMAHAAAGHRPAAARIVRQLERLRGKRYVLPYNIAKIHASAHDRARTLQWLETAYEGGNPDLIELNSEPLFDFLRNDAQFTRLMRRVGWDA
jgi:TolB-like protein/Tfp pilus assembly protein PilF